MLSTNRKRAIAKALTALLPMAPFADIEKIREMASQRDRRELPASIAVWIATITYVRHEHSSYDSLLAEGYERDAARFFVIDEINETLTKWRATRLLDADDGE
jgi:hypothetical protein